MSGASMTMTDVLAFIVQSFIPSLISTFLGFVSALALQYFLGKRNKLKKRNVFIQNIRSELYSVLKEIEEHAAKNKKVTTPFFIPVWEAVVGSGLLLEMLDNKQYELFVVAYMNINQFNKTCDNGPVPDPNKYVEEISSCINQIKTEVKVKEGVF